MFNLIVAVISIALIAAMAAASIYYGGDGFGKSSARAEAATMIGQGEQIAGAAALFRIKNSGSNVASSAACDAGVLSECAINRLVDGGFLQAIPKPVSDVAIQPIQKAMLEYAFGAPAGAFDWAYGWTVSDNGDAGRAFLSEIAAENICAEVEDQGGGSIHPWPLTTLSASGFGISGPGDPQYRCVAIDLSFESFAGFNPVTYGLDAGTPLGSTTVTLFAYRL